MVDLPDAVLRLIDLAIDEDVGPGDVTAGILTGDITGTATIVVKEPSVACGLAVAGEVFARIDGRIVFRGLVQEGSDLAAGSQLAEAEGPVRSLLTGERTVLNFLQRMCGVATLSRRYSQAARNRTIILDSRKTIPGWRWLDKLAVRTGGCSNHRMGLYDGILIKENHIAACGGLGKAVRKARTVAPKGMVVEVEVEDLEQLAEAVEEGVDIVMLDNFTPAQVSEAVRLAAGSVKLEVSGGIHLDNLDDYLQAGGLDFVSVGALTHSAPAVDISMEVSV